MTAFDRLKRLNATCQFTHGMSRRSVLGGMAAGVAASALPRAARAQQERISLLTWDAYADPRLLDMWREQTGIDVRYEIHISDPTSVNRLRAGETSVWEEVLSSRRDLLEMERRLDEIQESLKHLEGEALRSALPRSVARRRPSRRRGATLRSPRPGRSSRGWGFRENAGTSPAGCRHRSAGRHGDGRGLALARRQTDGGADRP